MSPPDEKKKITLDEVTRDARELLDPEVLGAKVDWDRVERAMMMKVEREAKASAAKAKLDGGRSRWVAVAVVLAAAAAVPLFLARGSSRAIDGGVAVAETHAGSLAWKEGAGDVRVFSGEATTTAAKGSALAVGDRVETHGARAVFERGTKGEPGSVVWTLEDGGNLAVRGAGGALVLALNRGAIEAQVTPVSNGEAFAVDVDDVRVAVHGTHLRVARDGSKITVDLTEGVVSIGSPPRVGSTMGDLVTAPAHVELDASDPHGSLKVTHEVARVRTAVSLRQPEPPAPVAMPLPREFPAPAAPAPKHATPAVEAPKAPEPPPIAALPAPSAPAPAPAAAPTIDPHPQETIASAVLACAREHAASHPDDVTIEVHSRLVVRVGTKGTPEYARFDPPLAPAVQDCASRTIYKTLFAMPGEITIPIDFKR